MDAKRAAERSRSGDLSSARKRSSRSVPRPLPQNSSSGRASGPMACEPLCPAVPLASASAAPPSPPFQISQDHCDDDLMATLAAAENASSSAVAFSAAATRPPPQLGAGLGAFPEVGSPAVLAATPLDTAVATANVAMADVSVPRSAVPAGSPAAASTDSPTDAQPLGSSSAVPVSSLAAAPAPSSRLPATAPA